MNIFDKVINVDLQDMHFEDDFAHSEIHRCLKRPGYYIFTVPFVPAWTKNQIRVNSQGAEDAYLLEKKYHGDPVTGKGVLVYRIYGNELIEHLVKTGFEVQFDNEPDHGKACRLRVYSSAENCSGSFSLLRVV